VKVIIFLHYLLCTDCRYNCPYYCTSSYRIRRYNPDHI